MKVVINACYGGFGVSRKAFHRLRELGSDVALREPDYDENWDDGSGPRKPFGGTGRLDSFCTEIPRDSPLLVQVVEELGPEASAAMARLKVVEIPDGIEWEIDDYDGFEKVEEKHRSWG
jgi:hypothetical protein